MKVKCPGCNKLYELADSRLKPEGVKIRCKACGKVFLVRPKAGGAKGDNTQSGRVRRADDDLSAFFGDPGPSQAPAGGPSLDDLFGAVPGTGRAGAGNDVFSAPPTDELFGRDEDLFSKPVGDLFGTSDDLVAGPGTATAPAAGPRSEAAPRPSVSVGGEGDLRSLFDESQDEAPAAAPAAAGAKPAPNFDWDDEQTDDRPTPSSKPSGSDETEDELPADLAFMPGIQQHEAEKALRDTLVQEKRQAPRRTPVWVGVVVGAVVAVCAAAAALFLTPLGRTWGIGAAPAPKSAAGLQQPGSQPPRPAAAPKPVPREPVHMTPQGTPQRMLVDNRRGMQLLVITGELKNDDSLPQSFTRLRVELTGGGGQVVTATEVYAGNVLTQLQLKNFPLDELNSLLQVEMGDGLKNFNVQPGQTVGYMAVFGPAPENAADLNVHVRAVSSHRGAR